MMHALSSGLPSALLAIYCGQTTAAPACSQLQRID